MLDLRSSPPTPQKGEVVLRFEAPALDHNVVGTVHGRRERGSPGLPSDECRVQPTHGPPRKPLAMVPSASHAQKLSKSQASPPQLRWPCVPMVSSISFSQASQPWTTESTNRFRVPHESAIRSYLFRESCDLLRNRQSQARRSTIDVKDPPLLQYEDAHEVQHCAVSDDEDGGFSDAQARLPANRLRAPLASPCPGWTRPCAPSRRTLTV